MSLPWSESEALDLIEQHRERTGPLLPVLHALQAHFGYIDSPRVIPLIARALRLSAAEVEGVLTFYDDFSTTPHAGPVVRICRGESCQAQGARALEVAFARCAPADVVVEPVFCLGNCMFGPSARVDGILVARATAERIVHRLKVGTEQIR